MLPVLAVQCTPGYPYELVFLEKNGGDLKPTKKVSVWYKPSYTVTHPALLLLIWYLIVFNVRSRHCEAKKLKRFIFAITLSIFSERELDVRYVFVRPSVCLSVCRLSVCNVRAPCSRLKFSAIFLRHLIRWWPDDIQVKFYGDRPRGTLRRRVKPKNGRKM